MNLCIWHSTLPVRDTYFLLPAARDVLEMRPLFNHEAPDMKNIILKDETSLSTYVSSFLGTLAGSKAFRRADDAPCSNRGNLSSKSSHVFQEIALSRTGRVAKDCADDIGGEGDETVKDIVRTRVL
jgi:hypothetical protein